ncbi:MAG: hypothetical protein KGQ84_11610 [Proteobacteria bacterium]|nr:hypothetical protein [Pseudomonadota bacterium]
MSKSKNPKITREEREALAAVRPGLDALREALRKPLPATAEHEAAAHRRIAAWAEAWAQTPPLVQAKFNWLEDRVTELLRDRVELDRLKDRLAQEADKSASSGAKGGRPPEWLDDEIKLALEEVRARFPDGLPVQRLILEVSGVVNLNCAKQGRELIAPETLARRIRQLKKKQGATSPGAAKPRVSRDAG